jgi:hypothetical protein
MTRRHLGAPARSARCLLPFVASLVAACAAAPAGGGKPILDDAFAALAPALPPTDVPEVFADVLGFDALEPFDEAQAPPRGARLLYRLRAGAGGRVREWLMRVELGTATDRKIRVEGSFENPAREFAFSSGAWRCRVSMWEVGGAEVVETSFLIAEESMRHSLFDAASSFQGGAADAMRDGELKAYVFGLFSPPTLVMTWQENEVLSGILKSVIGWPPLLAGLRAVLEGSYHISMGKFGLPDREVDLGPPVGVLPMLRVPCRVLVGGTIMLECQLDLVDGAVPLCVGLGLVGLRGVSPSDPRRWIAVDLLGARRPPGSLPPDP